MSMATVIHLRDLVANTTFEPPCNISYGISRETVKNASMVMGYTTSSPVIRNQRHYHINCDVGQYRITGHDRTLIGPDYDQERIDVEPGDFCYIPKGEIHGTMGQVAGGQKEPIALIFCYVGVSSKEESGTVFVEPPWDQEAHARSIARESSESPSPTGKPGQGAKRRARLIRTPTEDKLYAAPLILRVGIDSRTVGNVSMVMGTAMMPPGARGRRHYNVNADLGMYKVKGHERLLVGPDHEMQEMDFAEGDFAYVPKGEIHGSINLDDQPGAVLFCYVGVGGLEDTGRIYIEPPVK
jgi:uncharacterized RmlC-like cupin family protein